MSESEYWSADRESEVFALFQRRKPHIPYLASCACPRDGRLLGAISRLTDGIWVWRAGIRLSPSHGREEFKNQFLDCLDQTEWTPEIYRQADQFATEELEEWGGRLETPPTVMRLIVRAPDDPILVADKQSPHSRAGIPYSRVVTCGCRRCYLLPVLDLITAGLRADLGHIASGIHVTARRLPTIDEMIRSRVQQ